MTVFQPSQAHLIYVQAPQTPPLTVSGTLGTREDPFPTIAQGMAAALIGDDVLVLPGTYREDVVVKPGVSLLSAALSSTDTTFNPGSPYSALIYGVLPTGKPLTLPTGNDITTVSITGAIPGIPTEVRGFGIISPLVGNTVTGTIDPTNVAILANNSNALIDRNIIINAGVGVMLETSGANAPASTVELNVINGNIDGIEITDQSSTTSQQQPFFIFNNTIADNTIGLLNISSHPNVPGATSPFVFQAYVQNNIFFSNHDLSTGRTGTGIQSMGANTLAVGNNLFYQNGPNNSAASNATGSFEFAPGVVFNPSVLSASPDILGNLIGNPFFAQAEDARPNGDTPAVFFSYSNFDLTSRSAAINAANEPVAPATDFLYRSPVPIAGHGSAFTGPASIGAFYYLGTGTNAGSGTGIIFGGGADRGFRRDGRRNRRRDGSRNRFRYLGLRTDRHPVHRIDVLPRSVRFEQHWRRNGPGDQAVHRGHHVDFGQWNDRPGHRDQHRVGSGVHRRRFLGQPQRLDRQPDGPGPLGRRLEPDQPRQGDELRLDRRSRDPLLPLGRLQRFGHGEPHAAARLDDRHRWSDPHGLQPELPAPVGRHRPLTHSPRLPR